MYDCIVVGAGTAGLTAAIYLRRANKKVLVLEAKTYGGAIINTLKIENYPAMAHISGFDYATKIYNQAKELGSEILFEKVIDIKSYNDYKEVITNKNIYTGKTIILATGSENRKLGLENEDELLGNGISYCAMCDGNFYKDKVVAVVGNESHAVEDAIYLSNIASKVYLINKTDRFKCDEELINSLKESKIEVLLNSRIKKLNANEKLESIEINSNGNSKIINIDGLFVAIGRVPENQNFAKIINLDKSGYVIAGEDCNTNVPGIFVAGDNRVKKLRQLVTAASDGAMAATEVIKYISSNKE